MALFTLSSVKPLHSVLKLRFYFFLHTVHCCFLFFYFLKIALCSQQNVEERTEVSCTAPGFTLLLLILSTPPSRGARLFQLMVNILWFGLMCNDMYLSLWSKNNRFTSLKILCSACSSSALHTQESLTITDLFIVSILLPFPECHILGITQFVASPHWILSITNMHLSFLYVFSWTDSLFLFNL